MTRDEVLARLRETRAAFDALVAAIPRDRLDVAPAGRTHTPKEIVAHVAAYDELMVERLRAARAGRMTAFDRDRVGWERFNDRVWAEARALDVDEALAHAARVFADLLAEVERLTDAELGGVTGVTAGIDPAWLQGRMLAEVIGVDGFEHYPMHFEALEAARR